MEVIAHKINNPRHSDLHWEFIEETCLSFNAKIHDKNSIKLPAPKANIIALRHDKGASICELDLSGIDTILVGCDDSGNDNWLDPYRTVRIVTPNSYYLWSAVALGITLHAFNHEKIGFRLLE